MGDEPDNPQEEPPIVEPKKEEKKGFWGKLWDMAVVEPLHAIKEAFTGPPVSTSYPCRFFKFLSALAKNLLILWPFVLVVIFVIWLLFMGIGGALAGAGGVPGVVTWVLDTIATFVETLLWIFIAVGLVVVWLGSEALCGLFC